MFNITNDTLEKWLKEDIPYMDLTTCIMDIGSQNGEMHFSAGTKPFYAEPRK